MIVAYFWSIKPSKIPFAIKAMGFDRFSFFRDKNVSFYKSLGTGKGETFTPSDANALQWGLVAVVEDIEGFDSSAVVKRWRKNSISEFRAVLEPISSHGKWAGKEPFVATAKDWDGQVAANIGAEFIGFTLLLTSSALIGIWAYIGKHKGILFLQFFYAAAGVIGMIRWF